VFSSRLKTFLFFRSFSLTFLSGTLPDLSAFEVATLWRYTNIFIIIYYYFLTPVLSSQGMKKNTLCHTNKYKNQAGMNLTPPPPSQNSHAVRWHCTAESEQRVAEIKS